MPLYLIKISASASNGNSVTRPFEAPDFRSAKTVAVRRLDHARQTFRRGVEYDTWEIFRRDKPSGKHVLIACGKAAQS